MSQTTMTELRKAQKSADGSAPVTGFPAMLKKLTGEIGNALPRHMNADRMTRIALTEFRKNKQLAECDPRTVCASIVIASQLGLEPGVLGQGYLVPYRGTCQFIPGWQGFADLVSRTGRASVWTGAVYAGDEFEYALGDSPFLKHRPGDGDQDEGNLLYVYAIGRIKDAQWPVIEVWSVSKVKKHRDRYNKVGAKHYSYGNFELYARKIALLQVIKYMPKSTELAMAVDLDNSASGSGQKISLDDALKGEYVDISEPSRDDEKSPDASPTDNSHEQSSANNQVDRNTGETSPPSDLYIAYRDEVREANSIEELAACKEKVAAMKNAVEKQLLVSMIATREQTFRGKSPSAQATKQSRNLE